MQKLQIVPFEDRYAVNFAELNLEWIEKYFEVEPQDRKLLLNCKESIIYPGGHIFFAKIEEEIVGTFALIKVKEGVYEMGKMGVSPKYRGYKIGQQLLQFCIQFAKQQPWDKLILYSNIILENAIHIYRKYGFVEVPLDGHTEYKRSNIMMELTLHS
ncbi:ribosomal protein S18 acetylase RimI-like enzyme [Saonia flava]|uniref:Ribosomal protein S18 acetylase RimI-like enzyme n=1 Tax=Saonia flava TaxID=523696 RepID=A0A846QUF5_9FLAO|nr:GNAT family N-acetyltransferase [Saonia flava]NJB70847.1 ribosomal protein S18 acetylase RimI-like enzyme [Saonia flava]